MIRFNCSSCGKLVEVPDQHAGKKGKCPHCQMLMEIPQASAAEGPPASEPAAPPAPALRADVAPQDDVAAPPGAWYYAVSGQRQGPLSAPALTAQIQAGQLPPTVQVWRSGMDNWAPANTLAEFQQVAAPTAIVPQAAAFPAPAGVPPTGPMVPAGIAAARQWQGAAPQTCGQAIAALVLGCIPCTCIPPVLAIIFGHMALSKINKSQGQLKGRGMAICGLVLGYIFVTINIIYGIMMGIQAANM